VHISNYIFYITPIAALIAFAVSLTILFQPAKERYLRYFSAFLLVNFLMECLGGYLALAHINNILSANLETTLVISFDLFLIHDIVYRKFAKKILSFIVLFYPLFALVDIFFIQVGAFHTISYSLGSLLIVIACIYYFWELFQQSASEPLSRQPAFWICSGLLFYYACTFPIYGTTKLLEALPAIIIENLYVILELVNILLYLSFSIAFLCRLKTRKSMSSF